MIRDFNRKIVCTNVELIKLEVEHTLLMIGESFIDIDNSGSDNVVCREPIDRHACVTLNIR